MQCHYRLANVFSVVRLYRIACMFRVVLTMYCISVGDRHLLSILYENVYTVYIIYILYVHILR